MNLSLGLLTGQLISCQVSLCQRKITIVLRSVFVIPALSHYVIYSPISVNKSQGNFSLYTYALLNTAMD